MIHNEPLVLTIFNHHYSHHLAPMAHLKGRGSLPLAPKRPRLWLYLGGVWSRPRSVAAGGELHVKQR